MGKIVFYYDETFHDRRLSTKDGVLNAYLDNSYDGFVYSLLGTNEEYIKGFLDEYGELETKTKTRLGLKSELKSVTFNNKFFKYGLSSMKNDCKKFYFGFINLLIKHNLSFQIGYISKTELLIHRFLQCVKLPSFIPYKSFVYSLTKLLENHRLEYLFTNLLSDNKNNVKAFAFKIIELLRALLNKIQGIPREEIEIIVINNVIQILKNSKYIDGARIDDTWDYFAIADGVKNRIKETNKLCYVVLDNEQSTYESLVSSGINCEQQDSEDSVGIRATDMLVGFVGRIIKSLKYDRKEQPLKDLNQIKREAYTEKRLISKEWFDIDIETFSLCKRLGTFFSSATHWSSFVSCYADDLIMFFSFFNYINSYDDYSSFLEKKRMHNEYFNTYVCLQIRDLYSEEANVFSAF